MTQLVHLEIKDGIAIVTINNPPMNVLNSQVTAQLKQIISKVNEDPQVITIILTGAGDRAFMAGADIKEFPDWMNIEKDELKTKVTANHQVFNMIDHLPKPTIALLNGYTFGGGCELALACDIRIAEDHAQIGLPEVKLGLFPGGGGTQRLPRLVGKAKAKELMFLGEPITASIALDIGLVNQVVPKGEGMTAAKSMAQKMSQYSLQALSRIKQAVNNGEDLAFESAIELEVDLFADIFGTDDVKEGVQAFIEKRPATFTHR